MPLCFSLLIEDLLSFQKISISTNVNARVAHNIEEEKQFIEAGFEYVTKGLASRSTGNTNNPFKRRMGN